MTLIVAADAQDHLILAGDHCAVLSNVSTGETPGQQLRNYRKVYPWKYGAIGASGDVFLLAYWWRLFMQQDSSGGAVDLLQAATDAKQARTRDGVPPNRATANIFCTLPGEDGFALHAVYVGAGKVRCEVIEPISSVFSMREGGIGEDESEAFVSRLRPSFFFEDPADCERCNINLLARLFAEQSTRDSHVTASFDLAMLCKESGAIGFWRIGEPAQQSKQAAGPATRLLQRASM